MDTMQQTRPPATSARQRVGLGIAGGLAVANLVIVLWPTPEGEVGPPLFVLVLGAALGLVALVSAAAAWRSGHPLALRLTAGATILPTLLAVPAFFVPVPAGIKALVGLAVLVTLAAVVLMFSSPRPASGSQR